MVITGQMGGHKMRKIILFLLLILFPVTAFAGIQQFHMMIINQEQGTASCTTAVDACVGTDDGVISVGNANGRRLMSSLFVADANISAPGICSVTLRLAEVGTYAGNLTVEIWSDDGTDQPSAQIGTSSDALTASDIPATVGDVTAINMTSGALTSGTKYHIVLESSTADGSNYVDWSYEDADCVGDGEEVSRSVNGSSWVSNSSSIAGEFQGYSN